MDTKSEARKRIKSRIWANIIFLVVLMQRLSQTFIPLIKESQSIASTFLTKSGYLRQSSSGIYTVLPLGQRVLDKLESIITSTLSRHSCSKLTLPCMLTTNHWKKTGRISGTELYFVNKDTILAPTLEEEVTGLIGSHLTSYKQLPIRVYQIGKKFRNEKRPRGGLLRGREFIMKYALLTP